MRAPFSLFATVHHRTNCGLCDVSSIDTAVGVPTSLAAAHRTAVRSTHPTAEPPYTKAPPFVASTTPGTSKRCDSHGASFVKSHVVQDPNHVVAKREKKKGGDVSSAMTEGSVLPSLLLCQVSSRNCSELMPVWLLSSVLTSLHFTSLHFTSRHFTSLHFTSLHFTSLHVIRICMDRYSCTSSFAWRVSPFLFSTTCTVVKPKKTCKTTARHDARATVLSCTTLNRKRCLLNPFGRRLMVSEMITSQEIHKINVVQTQASSQGPARSLNRFVRQIFWSCSTILESARNATSQEPLTAAALPFAEQHGPGPAVHQ